MKTKGITLMELFAGCGGFALGLQQAGFTFSEHYYSEVDRYAIANYSYNFNKATNLGDVRKIDAKKFRDKIDILTFGSPCQDLSNAGLRKGLEGQRSGLFFEAIRIIKECRPRLFLFENVKGLFWSDEGKDFTIVLQEIAKLGIYECQWQLVNTSWFLPQNRERIYLVGSLGKGSSPEIFPLLRDDRENIEGHKGQSIIQGDLAPTIDTRVGEQTNGSPYVVAVRSRRSGDSYKESIDVRKDRNTNAILGNNKSSFLLDPWKPMVTERTDEAKIIRREFQKHGRDHHPYNRRQLAFRKDDTSNAVMSSPNRDNLLGKGNVIRRLTPTECERLQGLPDDWTALGNFDGSIKKVSDTQRYKMIGNAVSIPVVEAIGTKLQGLRVPKKQSGLAGTDISNNDIMVQDLKGIHKEYGTERDASVAYYRARVSFIEKLIKHIRVIIGIGVSIEEEKKLEKDIDLLRSGLILDRHREIADRYKIPDIRTLAFMENGSKEGDPLTFAELTSFNTWFAMHPEKIAGKEEPTTSLAFPVTIKGTKEDIERAIQLGMGKGEEETELEEFEVMLDELSKELEQMDFDKDMNGNEDYGLHGLQDDAFFNGLGGTIIDRNSIQIDPTPLRELIEKSKKEQEKKKVLDFADIDKMYNKSISTEEKKAWVWYKRSLGHPMNGWEKYHHKSTKGEKGRLIRANKDTVIKNNRWQDVTSVKKGRVLGKPSKFKHEYQGITYLVFTGLDGNKYLVDIGSTTEISTDVTIDEGKLTKWVMDGVLFYSKGDLLPYPYFAYGNMYDKELTLREDEKDIVGQYGQEVYDRHLALIKKLRPRMLTVTNPDAGEMPKILSISEFAREFKIGGLRMETGVQLPENMVDEEGSSYAEYNLIEAFRRWLRTLDLHHFSEVNATEIITYYIDGKQLSRSFSKDKKSTVDKYARIEGEQLFSKFLNKALLFDDQQKIDFSWNREYNGYSSVPYHRVPIGFRCSSMFKSFELQFTAAQREAIAFMEIANSAIIAYDVGVGKTMSAIITAANALYSEKCKRPLIVVPNATYKKWIREIIGYEDEKSGEFVQGVLSHIPLKINEWYNLGKGYKETIDLMESVEENSITVVTYEGMNKIGFSQKVIDLLLEELSNILAQVGKDGKTARDIEKIRDRHEEIIGMGLKDTIADIDTLGFDYMIIDEAHNFKNIFDQVPTDSQGRKRFKISGSQSDRGIKCFFLCHYVQRTYGGNVMLLTATPFTNSPLEIYSMLSLVGYESMRRMGIVSLERFMETFILQSVEYVNTVDGKIAEDYVIKSFNNRLVLQKLIHNHISYKTGEEAGVKRPCLISLPLTKKMDGDGVMRRLPKKGQIVTYHKMTDEQRANQRMILLSVQEGRELAKQGNKAVLMRAMGQSLDNALSPFLYIDNRPPDDHIDFVENSPKIYYALLCIGSVKSYHEEMGEPVSGQVIYMNRGKRFFPYIKDYLEKEIGYKQGIKYNRRTFDEVEIITGGISVRRKESIKDAFLGGVVKVIIGTSTIMEGIDLQNRASCLYNLYPGWNPKDIQQINGRIWRQGNMFGYVRVSMPLVEDSMDIFVFQKLDEKTGRTNDIWFKGDRGNVIDLDTLDPEEVKFALFTNIDLLTAIVLDREKKELGRKLSIAQGNLETMLQFKGKLQDYDRYKVRTRDSVKEMMSNFREYLFGNDTSYSTSSWWYGLTEANRKSFLKRARKLIKEAETFMESAEQEDKELLRLSKAFIELENRSRYFFTGLDRNYDRFRGLVSDVRKAEKTVMGDKGFTVNDNLDEVVDIYTKERDQVSELIEKHGSSEYIKGKKEEVEKKKDELTVLGGTPQERAEDFAKLNYLLDFRASDTDGVNCGLPKRALKARKPQKLLVEKTMTEEEERELFEYELELLKIELELLSFDE